MQRIVLYPPGFSENHSAFGECDVAVDGNEAIKCFTKGVVMKMGKIEKDVKVPVIHSKFKYPWEEMEIGDSVFIKADEGETLFNLKQRKVGSSARHYGAVSGKKFKTLMVREDNGVRVWRVK